MSVENPNFNLQKKSYFDSLPILEKNLPLKDRLNQLFQNKVLYENEDGVRYILQTGSRIAVIADVNGVKIPFYQSSQGTDGKVPNEWYPFFGNKAGWLIKGATEDSKKGYDIPEVKDMMQYLNNSVPEYLFINLLTKEQAEMFGSATWRAQVGGNEKVKNIHKEFIMNQDEARNYLAKVLGYNTNNAPDQEEKEKVSAFLKQRLKSIKDKLEIFRKF